MKAARGEQLIYVCFVAAVAEFHASNYKGYSWFSCNAPYTNLRAPSNGSRVIIT